MSNKEFAKKAVKCVMDAYNLDEVQAKETLSELLDEHMERLMEVWNG